MTLSPRRDTLRGAPIDMLTQKVDGTLSHSGNAFSICASPGRQDGELVHRFDLVIASGWRSVDLDHPWRPLRRSVRRRDAWATTALEMQREIGKDRHPVSFQE
jgi:hypothetical protein